MKILLYDPYFNTLGGGEKYLLDIYSVLKSENDVTLGVNTFVESSLLNRFSYAIPERLLLMNDYKFTRNSIHFDVTISVTNYVPLISKAKFKVSIVQFPFSWPILRHPIRRLLLKNILSETTILVYSEYVSNWVEQKWKHKSIVLNPAIETGTYDCGLKENIILNVGRFFKGGHSKRHDLMIEAFSLLPPQIRNKWRLVLVGGVKNDSDSMRYLAELKMMCKGLNIDIIENAPSALIKSLYSKASIYWHATGFRRNQSRPEAAEHFGITTAEAMSYGAVPVVFKDGGQPEIIADNCGILWETLEELTNATVELIGNADLLSYFAQRARERSKKYSLDAFSSQVRHIVNSA